ncbi:MAG: type II secretion system protein [Candidatus Gygaella obscura]|nr:type II secretion system protein [Candidatus Gygaella obscura]
MNKKSFTLIEMVIVVAIIATLTTIAVPYYKDQAVRVKTFAAQKYIMLLRDTLESYTIVSTSYPNSLSYLAQTDPPFIPYAPCSTQGSKGEYKGYNYHCQELTDGTYQISSTPLSEKEGKYCWRVITGGIIQKRNFNTKNNKCNGPWQSP